MLSSYESCCLSCCRSVEPWVTCTHDSMREWYFGVPMLLSSRYTARNTVDQKWFSKRRQGELFTRDLKVLFLVLVLHTRAYVDCQQ